MHTSSTSRHRVPYGLAFPVHELVFIRAWATARGLAMDVLLDQVLDGAEVEEMLIVRASVRSRRALTLWRVEGGNVVAQVKGEAPRVFGGIHAALSQAACMFAPMPARARAPWRRLLGWCRAR